MNHKPLCYQHQPNTSPWANPLNSMNLNGERAGSDSPKHPHSEATRLAALAVYAETGNQALAAETVGLSAKTVHEWVHNEEAPQIIDDLRSTIRYNCGWQLAQMVQRRLATLDDAFHRGDANLLRDGRIIYTPPKWKDQVIGLSILMDKWMLISGAIAQSASLTAGMAKLGAKLDDLGAALAPKAQASAPAKQDPVGELLLE